MNPSRSIKFSPRFFDLLPAGVKEIRGPVEQRLLAEYGAAFVAQGVRVPPVVVFEDAVAVRKFQDMLETRSADIGGFELVLQREAMEALLDAVAAAAALNLTISPRGPDSAARSYELTVELWNSRVEPALDHWAACGRIDPSVAARIRSLKPFEQVPIIFELEQSGIYFAKDLSKSIIYSVAPPGSSQHLSLLAFDVKEFDNAAIRQILNHHGWFQTVISDLPHFTYLGAEEPHLRELGLERVESGGRVFWIPELYTAIPPG